MSVTNASRTALEEADLPRVWLRPTEAVNRSEWLRRNAYVLLMISPQAWDEGSPTVTTVRQRTVNRYDS